jgi:hypothetical protein
LSNLINFVVALGAIIGFAGCGTVTPQLHVGDDSADANALFVQAVTTHVHCELRRAIFYTYNNIKMHNDAEWLKEWSAKITLIMNVDEKTALNPGATLTSFFPNFQKTLWNGDVISDGRTFNLGLGAGLSANAVREQQITWFIVFSDVFNEKKFVETECETTNRLLIDGDLKINEALASGAFPASLERNMSDPFQKGGRLQVIQHQVSFTITTSGSVSPRWNFVEVTANTGDPFFSINRNRKDSLLITMGPTELGSGRELKKKAVVPANVVETNHTAKLIGDNVGTSILNLR